MADAFPGAMTPAQIADVALRKIGVLSAYETEAEGPILDIALRQLATIINEVSGNRQCWWLVPSTLTFDLTANTWEYDLSNALGASWPANGVQWVVEAWVRASGSNASPQPVEIVRRDQIEALPTAQSGTPCLAYIDRTVNKTLRLDAAPGTSDPTLTMGLVVQTYAPDVTDRNGSAPTEFGPAWDMWLQTKLAIQLGDGILTVVEVSRLDRWRVEATDLWSALMSGAAQQRVSSPPICDPYPF